MDQKEIISFNAVLSVDARADMPECFRVDVKCSHDGNRLPELTPNNDEAIAIHNWCHLYFKNFPLVPFRWLKTWQDSSVHTGAKIQGLADEITRRAQQVRGVPLHASCS